MSSVVRAAFSCAASFALMACTAQGGSEDIVLDLGDVEYYADFLADRDDVVEPEPFKPEPLFVSAVGKVQAQPNIAVITAVITAEDKNESRAVNEMGEIINHVQTALKGRDIETGFTAINSTREFDERCRNENRFAWRRQNQIQQDYNFNKNLDRRGDTKTKRRFGPQPNVIRPANRYQGPSGSAIDRQKNNGYNKDYYSKPAPVALSMMETVTVQEASTELVTIPATYETVMETVVTQEGYTDANGNSVPPITQQVAHRVVKTPASTQERVIPAVTRQQSRRVLVSPGQAGANGGRSANTNALSISLLSGPQTVSVTANLGYTYETPLNGKIIVEPEDE